MRGRKQIAAAIVIVAFAFVLGAVAFVVVNISNEAEPSGAERQLAALLFELKIRSHRPQTSDRRFPADDEKLERASSMYQQMCSFCHGAARGRMAPFAKSLSPRPPQFVIEPSHQSTWRDAYVIQHGIRWTGMPSFQVLSEADAWYLALYVEGRTEPKE